MPVWCCWGLMNAVRLGWGRLISAWSALLSSFESAIVRTSDFGLLWQKSKLSPHLAETTDLGRLQPVNLCH